MANAMIELVAFWRAISVSREVEISSKGPKHSPNCIVQAACGRFEVFCTTTLDYSIPLIWTVGNPSTTEDQYATADPPPSTMTPEEMQSFRECLANSKRVVA